jgi:hypothetical protein
MLPCQSDLGLAAKIANYIGCGQTDLVTLRNDTRRPSSGEEPYTRTPHQTDDSTFCVSRSGRRNSRIAKSPWASRLVSHVRTAEYSLDF